MRRLLILLLLSLNFMVLIIPKQMVYADGDLEPFEYRFDDFSLAEGNMTTSIDEETQIWTLNGHQNLSTRSTNPGNVFSPNVGGYSLSRQKAYTIKYEYISGTVTGGSFFIETRTGTQWYRQYVIDSTNFDLTHYTSLSANDDVQTFILKVPSGLYVENLKFKITFAEIDLSMSNYDLLISDFSTNQNNIRYWFYDGNTIKLDTIDKVGSYHSGNNNHNIDHIRNSFNPNRFYIFKYRYISGELTGNPSTTNATSAALTLNPINMHAGMALIFNSHTYNMQDIVLVLKGDQIESLHVRARGPETAWTIFHDFIYQILIEEINPLNDPDPEPIITHTISFELNGGVFVNGSSGLSTITVLDGETTNPPSSPSREGFTFSGWYQDIALTIEMNWSEAITSNYTLYAKWTPTGSGAGIDIPSEESDSTILIILLIVFGVGAFYLFTKKRRES